MPNKKSNTHTHTHTLQKSITKNPDRGTIVTLEINFLFEQIHDFWMRSLAMYKWQNTTLSRNETTPRKNMILHQNGKTLHEDPRTKPIRIC